MNIINFINRFTNKQKIFFIFFIALILRLGLIIILGQDQDLHEYGEIAINLMDGNGYSMQKFSGTGNQETCVMAPFYPFLIATFYWVFGINSNAILAIQITQSLIGASTVFPVYYLARDCCSRNVGILSSVIFAFYPDFLYSVFVVQKLVLTTFLIPTLTYFSYKFQNSPTIKMTLILGFLFAISLLVEPVIVAFLGVMILWTILFWIYKTFYDKKTKSANSFALLRKRIINLALLILICAIIIMPWIFRCIIVYDGRFVFIKANGFNLWRGNNPESTLTGIPSDQNYEYGELSKEGDIDNFYFNLAVEYILTHLHETIINILRKFLEFCWFPLALPEQSPLLRVILYVPILVLFTLSFFIDRRHFFKRFPLINSMVGFALIYSITFVLPRYRVPLQPNMLILSTFSLIFVFKNLLNYPKFLKKLNTF